ncbi:hypothetical protein Xekk_04058 [Xenorhabdus sp. KK7.4]|nr:hypothetical protein Xekk_04058 [Xenorhabdus sp. KK7.4]
MADVEVKYLFCQQTEYVKSMVEVKLIINAIAVFPPNESSNWITPIARAKRV